MKPKISILLPSYNYQAYITIAIESVIKQTYQNWELIIIDDGSKDDSIKVIKKYKDKRIRLYTQENKGVSKTLNKAFDLSKGEYICFLDADDFYHPEKLEKQLSLIESGYDIVTSHVSAVDKDGLPSNDKFFDFWWNTYNPNKVFGENIEYNFFNGNYLCKSALMMRKNLFQKYGKFNTNLITSYDLELWLKMIAHIKIGVYKEKLTFYRWHGLNETTTNSFRMKIELLLIYDKYLESLKFSSAKNNEKTEKFILAFIYFMRTHGLQDAYIGLQIIKQNKEYTNNIYQLLFDDELLSILKNIIEGKEISFEFIKNGQNKDLEKLLTVKETFFQKLRRTLIPYNIRKHLKKIFLSKK